PCTVIGWPDRPLLQALSMLPPGTQLSVAVGPGWWNTVDHTVSPLYTRWSIQPEEKPLGKRPVPLARFADGLTLLDARPTRSGKELTVRLRWSRNAASEPPAGVLAQLFDASGRVLAQSRESVGTDYYPSPVWAPGTVICQELTLGVPKAAATPLSL